MVMVIAEAGVNHNGDLRRAEAMIAAATMAGADVVKFQAFSARELVARNTETASYQRANTGETDLFNARNSSAGESFALDQASSGRRRW